MTDLAVLPRALVFLVIAMTLCLSHDAQLGIARTSSSFAPSLVPCLALGPSGANRHGLQATSRYGTVSLCAMSLGMHGWPHEHGADVLPSTVPMFFSQRPMRLRMSGAKRPFDVSNEDDEDDNYGPTPDSVPFPSFPRRPFTDEAESSEDEDENPRNGAGDELFSSARTPSQEGEIIMIGKQRFQRRGRALVNMDIGEDEMRRCELLINERASAHNLCRHAH